MATTTNYSWTTPDDTALVKDGAAAIRTLGSSIDTTTKALNPSTTLGDIEYRSSTANTNTRLGIGSTGQVLSVVGGVPSWANAPASDSMTLLTTTTLSGSSTTSATFSSSYKMLVMYLQNVVGSTAANLQLRLNGDTGSNYSYRVISSNDTTASGNATELFFGNISTTTGRNAGHSIITLMRPSDTNTVFLQSTTIESSGPQFWDFVGVYDNSAAITNVTFFPTGGTFSSGTVYIYGVN